jgi:hypothetical protein
MLDKSNVCATQNALQLPLQRHAAKQTRRSIGNECTSGVPKCNDAVGAMEAFILKALSFSHILLLKLLLNCA